MSRRPGQDGDVPPQPGGALARISHGSPAPAGRYVVLRDRDGRRTAVARSAVSAISEAEDCGALIYLPGGRVLCVEEDLDAVLGWLA